MDVRRKCLFLLEWPLVMVLPPDWSGLTYFSGSASQLSPESARMNSKHHLGSSQCHFEVPFVASSTLCCRSCQRYWRMLVFFQSLPTHCHLPAEIPLLYVASMETCSEVLAFGQIWIPPTPPFLLSHQPAVLFDSSVALGVHPTPRSLF